MHEIRKDRVIDTREDYIVKKLDIFNIDEIKTTFKRIFTVQPWNDDWSDEEQLHKYIIEIIGNQNSLTYGIYLEDEPIGVCMGEIRHWYSGTEYYINEIGIIPEYQGQGYGTEFIKKVEEMSKKMDIAHLFLQTGRNVPAFGFYQKNGFTELKEQVSLYKDL